MPSSEHNEDGSAPAEPESVPVVAPDGDDLPEVLEGLPVEQREALVGFVQEQLSHSGPLPPPGQLIEYDHALPGLAERIVRLTEREQEHRHSVVDYAVKRNVRLKERGQLFGMAALVLGLAFCAYLVWTGSPAIAGTVAIGLVGAVVGIFVTGRNADAKERKAESDDEDE